MNVDYDIAVVGGGPAGLSAALSALRRDKKTVVFDQRGAKSKLAKAPLVDNYLGLPAISGQELMRVFSGHVKTRGIPILEEKIVNIYPGGGGFTLIAGDNAWQSASVVFAAGAPSGQTLPGESDFLGRGVSYCAVCDGLLFRGKKVAIIAATSGSREDTSFLAGLCREILYFPLYAGEHPQHPNLKTLKELPKEITGADTVGAIKTDKNSHAVDGVFIFRANAPPDSILPDLALKDNFVRTDSLMRTNVPGFFAAGDCTGQPWQISRATGQGQIAALSAASYIDGHN
ncbi:MAG: NAD(P)/FAD-dependent oxidoreductase [Acidaminococcales bacterium]|nr:NAD(P)/FAD-dependent oxidoreductase [Acidaminococcales bacterium]